MILHYGMIVLVIQALQQCKKIIEKSHGHSLKPQEIYQRNKLTCTSYSVGNLIIRPSRQYLWTYKSTFWTILLFYGNEDGHTFVYCPLKMWDLRDSYLK